MDTMFTISFISLIVLNVNCEVYESYTGEPISDELLSYFIEKNLTSICTNNVEPCGDGNIWRRPDGTCNNLQYPSRGAFHTPQLRIIPADYGENYEPRLASTGEEMELGRVLKNKMLDMGQGSDDVFTQAIAYLLEFIFGDVGTIHDAVNYVLQTQYCCEEEGKSDYMCIPHEIPVDDDVHRFSGHRCMNLTRPLTFQNLGCVDNTTVPDRIDYATPVYDLSSVYYFNDGAINVARSYEGGLLKTETINDRDFPSDGSENCTITDAIETGCSRDVPNGLIGTIAYSIYFWRLHNYIAQNLAVVNSCWDDETLFQNARDITIGFYQNMLFYEVFPPLLGLDNLLENEIIQNGTGHWDPYDETVEPRVSVEFNYAFRWFHVIQNAIQKLYHANGTYAGDMPIVDISLKTQNAAVGDTFKQFTYGIHRHHCGGFDYTVHPDMTNRGLGPLQAVLDIFTSDLVKGRHFGFPSYPKYRDYCTNYRKKHKTFKDLSDYISPERLSRLQEYLPDVSDVELMLGIWSEELKEGTRVPHTVYCLMIEQLKRTVKADRYHFESSTRPHAFSLAQLQEVRKGTLARLLCIVEKDIQEIQPHAFLVIGEGNELCTCDEIPDLDLSHWADASCAST